MPAAWTREEVEATVADYFDMWTAHFSGKDYSKAEHLRLLQPRLGNRSPGSIEFKRGNISAVLQDLGYMWLPGYKPYSNYQQMLIEVVEGHLAARPEIEALARADAEVVPKMPTVDDILAALTDPPKRREKKHRGYERRDRRGRFDDHLGREARNAGLGRLGEEWVVRFEQARLLKAGHESLAADVEHVAVTKGDGLGYDVLSWEEPGRERLIEVKTTKYVKETPFYLSRNEVDFSAERPDAFHLYRVFDFREKPGLFTLPGELTRTCDLDPIQYQATVA